MHDKYLTGAPLFQVHIQAEWSVMYAIAWNVGIGLYSLNRYNLSSLS